MKCLSCSLEINPQWKYAIETNVCPFCGEDILHSQLIDLFSTLRSTIDQLLEFPNELSDWLNSNYGFVKADSENLVSNLSLDQIQDLLKAKKSNSHKFEKKTIKVNTENGEEEVEVQTIQDEQTTSEFAKRAGIKNKQGKTQHLKDMVSKIKNGEINSNLILTREELEDDVEAGYNPDLESGSASSALDYDSDEELPSIVQNMVRKAKANPSYNEKDMQRLNDLQNKQKGGHKNMLGGGGSFSR